MNGRGTGLMKRPDVLRVEVRRGRLQLRLEDCMKKDSVGCGGGVENKR